MFMLMVLGAPALAVAEPAADPQKPDIVIVTGTRLPEGAAEIISRPGGTDLVAASDYQDRVAVSLRDALAFSPGVYAQPRFGQEIRLSIRGSGISRGFHMRGLTLLLDGVPINLADDNGDFQELDPTTLDRLEIYRGANAFRFGGTTLGGAINGVTPTGLTAPGYKSRADGGSFDTLRSTLSAGFSSGAFDGWAALAGDRSDGDRDHSDRKAARFNGNAGWAPSDTFKTRFYVNANTIRQELPGALSYATVRSDPRTGNSFGDQARDIDSLRIQNRTDFSLGTVDVEGGAFLNVKSLYHPIFQVVDQDSVDRGLFGRAGWTNGRLQLWAGATARFGTVDARRYVNVDGNRGARTFEADQKARTIDLYGEGRFAFGEVTAIAGAITTFGRRRQEQSFPVAVTGSASFTEVSPRFGLLWEPRSDVQLYANVSRSHELPGFIELAQIAAFVPLEAQHAWTGEVGLRGKLGPVTLDLSLYRAAVRDELLQFTVGPDIPASTFNADKTLHQGIEAGLEVPLGAIAKVRTSYQYNDFRFVDDPQFGDNRLPVIPSHVVRSEMKLGTDRWTVAPGIEWIPRGAWADYANSFRAGGYTLFNVTGSVTVLPTTELFVDLRNVANRKAAGDISAVINYANLSPAQRAIFYPVERRALYFGLRSKFGGRTMTNDRYRAFWRWHFYAGILVLPFLAWLAITGGLYLFKPEIERAVYGPWITLEAPATALPTSRLIAATERHAQGQVTQIEVPASASESWRMRVETGDTVRTAFVDPATGALLGATGEGGIMKTVRDLHSLAITGTLGNALIEIAAGWAIVLVATGLVLWWPREGRPALALRRPVQRRRFWRDFHASTGILAAAVILFLAITGMPWSVVWGANLQRWVGEQGLGRPKAPGPQPWERGHAHGAAKTAQTEALPWSLQQSPMPHAHGTSDIGVDQAVAIARRTGLAPPFTIMLPLAPSEAYGLSKITRRAQDARALYIEPATGRILQDARSAHFGAGAKAIEWGIATHQGQQYGEPNRWLMLAGCLALLALAISSPVMWWKRRTAGRLRTPPRPTSPAAARSATATATIVLLGLLYPLTGLSALLIWLFDRTLLARLTTRWDGRPHSIRG